MIRSVAVERYVNLPSGSQRPFRVRLQESGTPYLTALFATPVMAQFTQYAFPGRSVLGAQSWSTVLGDTQASSCRGMGFGGEGHMVLMC